MYVLQSGVNKDASSNLYKVKLDGVKGFMIAVHLVQRVINN